MANTIASIRAQKRDSPKKKPARGNLAEAVKKTSLSRVALRFLAARSVMPPMIDEPPETPPFDLSNK